MTKKTSGELPQKMKMHSPDLIQRNIAALQELFPTCVTENRDKSGEPCFAVDFDLLRQELSDTLVEGGQERYQLDWPGKRKALLTANAPISKTLRPCRKESVDFDTTQNLFIEGDNLEALKLLQDSYLGKVKMIYIDPPYNTGNDFVYKDRFAVNAQEYLRESNQVDEEGNRLLANPDSNGRFHSDWLSMMYPRLKLARNLLTDDGVIVVHIDEHESANMEKLLAEIFGETNNIGSIVWDKRNPKGDAKGIASQHESIVFFAKSANTFYEKCKLHRPKRNADAMFQKVQELIDEAGSVTERVRKSFKIWLKAQDSFSGGERAYSQIDENGEIYQPVSMAWPNKKKAPDDYFVPLKHPVTRKNCPVPGRGWRNPSATMKKLLENGEILFGADEKTQPRRKYLLRDNLDENVPSLFYHGGSDDELLSSLGLFFDNPKTVAVSTYILRAVTPGSSDVILDFFSGSATTAHAVMQLNAEDGGNRRFIMIQIPENVGEESDAYEFGYKTIADIGKERIRRAGKKIKDELIAKQKQTDKSLLENENMIDPEKSDTGFRVLKIDTSNMEDVYYTPDALEQKNLANLVSNVKKGRKAEDLLFQVMLDSGVELSLPIVKDTKTWSGRTVYFVQPNSKGVKATLAVCFDENIDEKFIMELAKRQPRRIVFYDHCFASDAVKINVVQIFKQLSPGTDVKTI